MLTIRYYSSFKKDYKRIQRRGYDVRKLDEVINLLANEQPLPFMWMQTPSPKIISKASEQFLRPRELLSFCVVVIDDALQDVAGLAIKDFAYLIEGAKSDALDLAGFYPREVYGSCPNHFGKVFRRNPPFKHHHI